MSDKKVIKFSAPQGGASDNEEPSKPRNSKDLKPEAAKKHPKKTEKISEEKVLSPEESGPNIIRIEKKIWIWLGKYGKQCLYALLFICLAWGFYLVLKAVNEKVTQKHLTEYSQLKPLEERVLWAEKSLPHSLDNLRGFIFIENANACFQKEQWVDAQTYYQKAKALLKISPLKEQSMLGCAYTYLQMQKWDEAEKEFVGLCNICPFKILRAQALYALCYIAYRRGDQKKFERYQNQLKTYDEGTLFLQQLDLITSEH